MVPVEINVLALVVDIILPSGHKRTPFDLSPAEPFAGISPALFLKLQVGSFSAQKNGVFSASIRSQPVVCYLEHVGANCCIFGANFGGNGSFSFGCSFLRNCEQFFLSGLLYGLGQFDHDPPAIPIRVPGY